MLAGLVMTSGRDPAPAAGRAVSVVAAEAAVGAAATNAVVIRVAAKILSPML
jgi:hypothetical protein